MKQIITLSVVALFLGVFPPAQAQEKEDILALLEILFDLDDVQALYQHEMSQGPTLILKRPERRSLGRNYQDRLQNTMFELRNDDFSFFGSPVQVMTEREAQGLDIPVQRLVDMSLQLTPTEARIIINCHLWETRQQYSGQFSFIRESEDDEWELNSKNSDTRNSR